MMPEPNDPALRISHIVRGRERVDRRVRYRVDHHGILAEMAVPETVVLKRWRQRQLAGFRFNGERFSSTLWWATVDRAATPRWPAVGQPVTLPPARYRDKSIKEPPRVARCGLCGVSHDLAPGAMHRETSGVISAASGGGSSSG